MNVSELSQLIEANLGIERATEVAQIFHLANLQHKIFDLADDTGLLMSVFALHKARESYSANIPNDMMFMIMRDLLERILAAFQAGYDTHDVWGWIALLPSIQSLQKEAERRDPSLHPIASYDQISDVLSK